MFRKFSCRVDLDPVHNMTAMQGIQDSAESQTELIFSKYEPAVRVSVCLDRVSAFDVIVNAHFLKALEMHSGD